jgi:hypothetical protein
VRVWDPYLDTRLDVARREALARRIERAVLLAHMAAGQRVTSVEGRPIEACWVVFLHRDDEYDVRSQPDFLSLPAYGLMPCIDSREVGYLRSRAARVMLTGNAERGHPLLFGQGSKWPEEPPVAQGG